MAPTRPAATAVVAEPAASPAGTAAPTGTAAAQIQLVEAQESAAVQVADETVDRLLDEGRAPADILVLTTGEQHPWAQHELSFGEDAYWTQQAAGDDVFSAHVSALPRIAGRPVVVLAVNGGTDAEVGSALPAVMERAAAQLIVCGDTKRLGRLL
ncbi:hypothetical protein [Streptomyces sp. 549]|uniref:hypothetical protein n=1 Tax=Streptomyces sp. 549 TaxID=3049076 RepID=UPI0032E3681B